MPQQGSKCTLLRFRFIRDSDVGKLLVRFCKSREFDCILAFRLRFNCVFQLLSLRFFVRAEGAKYQRASSMLINGFQLLFNTLELPYLVHRSKRNDTLCREDFSANWKKMLFAATAALNVPTRGIFTSAVSRQIIKLSRLRVVDNSEIGKQAMMEGRPPRCIHVYNKIGVGHIGDRVLVAIKGEKKQGILVGLKRTRDPNIPKFDSNNIVLIDDTGTPLGTRIHVPIPHILRKILKEKTQSKGADYTKLLAIATKFV